MNQQSKISRRTLMKGSGALPLAALLASPVRAAEVAAGLQEVEITTANFGKKVKASLALPQAETAPVVLLIHEWWGLNDYIKTMAAELAAEGFAALAIDLYDGEVTDDSGRARVLATGTDPKQAMDTIASWVGWADAYEKGNGQVGVMGWCFGGGWTLQAAIHTPVDASVMYYGQVVSDPELLGKIDTPLMGHFAVQDAFIAMADVNKMEAEAYALGKDFTIHHYDADHAFANPTSARYEDEDAALSWVRTVDFLKKTLKG